MVRHHIAGSRGRVTSRGAVTAGERPRDSTSPGAQSRAGDETAPKAQRLPRGITRNGSGYRGTYYDTEHRRHRTRTYGTMRETLAALDKARAQVRRGEHVSPVDTRILLDEWWREWHPNRRIRHTTARRDESLYRLHIPPRLGRKPLRADTPYTPGHVVARS